MRLDRHGSGRLQTLPRMQVLQIGIRIFVTLALIIVCRIELDGSRLPPVIQSPAAFSGRWLPVPGASQPTDLPAGRPFTIIYDQTTLSVLPESGPPATYRLDGSETTSAIKTEDGTMRTTTSVIRWSGAKLVVTTRDGLSKHEIVYALADSDSGHLAVTESTTLLHTRLGALKVSTTGPFTRVYKKEEAVVVTRLFD